MDVRALVTDIIRSVAAEQSRHLAPLTDDLPLLDSGLDSLCLAVIIAKLEDRLNADPFGSLEAEDFPNTIGDLIRLYEHAAV